MALRYEWAKEQILKEIQLLKINQKLPSRTRMAEKLELSHATVDKAIRELVQEGVLYTVPGGGTYIKEGTGQGKIRNWALLIPDIQKELYPQLIGGIERYAEDKEINLIVCHSNNNMHKQRQFINRMLEFGIDGCIVVPTIGGVQDFDAFKLLQDRQIHMVFVNRRIDGISAPLVLNNSFWGAYQGTRVLLENGCRRVAFVSEKSYQTTIERYSGYMAAFYECGRNPESGDAVFAARESAGMKNLRELFGEPDRPDGVFCLNDEAANRVYDVLAEKNLIPGRDVQVVGYDDSRICQGMKPPLTSVSANAELIGWTAAEILDASMRGELKEKSLIKLIRPEIVYRNSCTRKGRTK